MKAGTVVKLPDGRRGTVVYNGLDGVGIKWGAHSVSLADLDKLTVNFNWYPDAMLREPYPSAELPCVGNDYEVEG